MSYEGTYSSEEMISCCRPVCLQDYTRRVVEKEEGTVPAAAAMLFARLGDSSVDAWQAYYLVMLHYLS
jgi:hypothetical protein